MIRLFRFLLILLAVVPVLEIWLLIQVGQWIGGWQTLLLILLTGFLGALFARLEARVVWNFARVQLARGQFPSTAILDGICVFAGGLLLLTPGFISDVLGFFLIFPLTRPFFRSLIGEWLRRKIRVIRI